MARRYNMKYTIEQRNVINTLNNAIRDNDFIIRNKYLSDNGLSENERILLRESAYDVFSKVENPKLEKYDMTINTRPLYNNYSQVDIESVLSEIPFLINGNSTYNHIHYLGIEIKHYLDNDMMFNHLFEIGYFDIMTKWSLKTISHFLDSKGDNVKMSPIAECARGIIDSGYNVPLFDDMKQNVAMTFWEMLIQTDSFIDNPCVEYKDGKIIFKTYESECGTFEKNPTKCKDCKLAKSGRCVNGIKTVSYIGKLINAVKRTLDRHGNTLVNPMSKLNDEYHNSAEYAYLNKPAHNTECSFLMCDFIAYIKEHANKKNQDDIIRLVKARSLGFKIVDIVSHLAQGDEHAEKVLKDRYKYISKLTKQLSKSFKREYPEYFQLAR